MFIRNPKLLLFYPITFIPLLFLFLCISYMPVYILVQQCLFLILNTYSVFWYELPYLETLLYILNTSHRTYSCDMSLLHHNTHGTYNTNISLVSAWIILTYVLLILYSVSDNICTHLFRTMTWRPCNSTWTESLAPCDTHEEINKNKKIKLRVKK